MGEHTLAMKSANKSSRKDCFQKMIPLGEYDWPRSETQQTLGHLFGKIKQSLAPKTNQDAVDVDTLETVSNDAFENDVRETLKGKLLASLDQAYFDWAVSGQGTQSRRLFVHPPMEDDLLAEWAQRHSLPTLEDGSRLGEMSDTSCIVIPKLESYFARRHDRLDNLHELFTDVSSYQGRILVGCNSWALRVLKQFDDVRLSLGHGDTFPACDANALASVLEEAIDEPDLFMSVSSGEPVFKRDEDGELCDPFLEELADRSLGHSWVAIEMFFQGMAEAKDEDQNQTDKQSWVQLPAACSLPSSGKDMILFALHSLLIHGTRKIDTFDELLPKRIPNGTWSELNRLGFVDLKDGYVCCAIRNYPDTRSELSAAGFNLDKL